MWKTLMQLTNHQHLLTRTPTTATSLSATILVSVYLHYLYAVFTTSTLIHYFEVTHSCGTSLWLVHGSLAEMSSVILQTCLVKSPFVHFSLHLTTITTVINCLWQLPTFIVWIERSFSFCSFSISIFQLFKRRQNVNLSCESWNDVLTFCKEHKNIISYKWHFIDHLRFGDVSGSVCVCGWNYKEWDKSNWNMYAQ